MHRTTEPKTWPNPRHPWIVLCSDAFSWPCLTKMIDMPYRFDEFSRRILHGFESPSNDESHEQFAFLSLCFFSFFTGLILVYGTTGKVFCLNTSGCYILILYWFVFLLLLFDDLVLHEWNGLDCYDYDVMVCKRIFLLLLCLCFCFCLLSFYYLPRVKPGNYSMCLCRSVWDMAFFLSYTLGQSTQVKPTCLFTWLIDWLANGLPACGQRGRRLVGWLVDFDGVDVDTRYLLLTSFLDLDLLESVHSFEYIRFVWDNLLVLNFIFVECMKYRLILPPCGLW